MQAGARFRFSSKSPGSTQGGQLFADSAGRVYLGLTGEWRAGMIRHVEIWPFRHDRGGRERGIYLSLGQRFPPGLTDLPDQQIARAPRLAAGRVVDEQGTALPGVNIELRHEVGSNPSMWAQPMRAQTDAEGRFAFQGTSPGRRVQISAFSATHRCPDPYIGPVGSQGIELVAPRIGGLRYGIRPLDELGCFQVILRRLDQRQPDWRESLQDDQAPVPFRSLLPGLYEFQLRLVFDEEPVFRTRVEIVAGETAAPEALQDLDLDRFTRRISLRLRDGAGRPVHRAMLDVGGRGFFTDREGRAFVRVAPRGVDVRFIPKHGAPLEFKQVRADLEMQLRVERAVEVRFPAMVHQVLGEGWQVAMDEVGEEGKLRKGVSSRVVALTSSGVVRIRLPVPGRYRPRIFKERVLEVTAHYRRIERSTLFDWVFAEPVVDIGRQTDADGYRYELKPRMTPERMRQGIRISGSRKR